MSLAKSQRRKAASGPRLTLPGPEGDSVREPKVPFPTTSHCLRVSAGFRGLAPQPDFLF